MGARHAARASTSTSPGGPRRGPARASGAIQRFDPDAGDVADRRRGARLRPLARARPQGDPPHRPLHPVRARRGARGDGPGRAARAARGRAGRARPGVIIGSGLGGVGHALRADSRSSPTRGPDRLCPFFIPMGIANIGVGPDRDHLRRRAARTTPRCQRLRHRPVTRSARRPRSIIRGDADMMIAGGSEAAHLRGRSSAAFAAMRALSTRNDDPAGACRPFDEGRDGFVIARGRRRPRPRGARARRGGAAPRSSPSCVGYGATADAIAHHAARARRRGRRPRRAAGARARPASTRPRSTTSAPTRRRRRKAIRPSCRRSRTIFGDHAPTSRSPRPRARSATRWARPAGSGPSPRSARCATAASRPTLNLVDPIAAARGPRPHAGQARQRDDATALSTRSASAARTPRSSSAGGTRDRAERGGEAPSAGMTPATRG